MAELPSALLELPLSGGLKQQVDKRLVQFDAFLAIQNLEHAKSGVLTNRKGYGYLAAPGRTVERVGTRGDELFGLAAGATTAEAPGVLAYHEGVDEEEDPSWTRQCDAWQVDVARRPVVRSYDGALCAQRVVIGARVVYVWVGGPVSTGALYYRVEDLAGGLIRSDRRFTTSGAVAPNCLFCVTQTAGKVVVVYYPNTGTKLRVLTLNPTTFAETDVITGVDHVQVVARRVFDAKAIPVAPGFVAIANPFCPVSAASQAINLTTINVNDGLVYDGVLGTTTGRHISAVQIRFASNGTVAGVAYRRLDSAALNDTVYVAQFSGFDASGQFDGAPNYDKAVFTVADALSFSDDGFLIGGTAVTRTASYGVGLCQDTAVDPDGWVVVTCDDWGTRARRVDDGGDVAGTATFFVASAHLLAEPFSLGNRVVALLGEFVNHVDDPDAAAKNKPLSAALVSLLPGIDAHGATGADPGTRYLVAAALLESVTSEYTDQISKGAKVDGSRGMMVPSFNADGSVSFPASVVLSTEGVDAQRGVDELRLSAAALDTALLDIDRVAVASGGLTAQYDGRDWTELGFLHRANALPVDPVFTVTGLGVDPGNYVYAFVYECQDAQGRIHQSEPVLLPVTVPGGGKQSVTLRIRCLGLTQKPSVGIVVYRTQNNGSLFFRISPRSNDGTPHALVSDPGVSDKTFVDDVDDAELAALSRGFLYTNSGIRGYVMAPPSRHAVTHQNRLWLIDAEDPNRLWFSNEIFEGQPPTFGRGNNLRIDGLPSAPTALASNGDRLVVFTAVGIYYLVGQGPDDTGLSGSFSPAFQVPTTCGCTDPRGVLSTHLGVFFLGQNGIMLFGVGGGLAPVGQAVEDEIAGQFCRRVVLDETERKIYWLFTAAESGAPGNSRHVVFEYDEAAWLVWRISPTGSQRDQCVWRGGHVVCDGRPALRGFGPTPAADPDGSYVSAFLRLPWVNLGGINGFQRLRWFLIKGRRNQPCNLRVRFFVDHDDAIAVQNKLYDLSSTSTVKRLPILELAVDVLRQLCANVMVEISHEPATGATNTVERAGVELVAPGFDLGVKKGRQKISALNRK